MHAASDENAYLNISRVAKADSRASGDADYPLGRQASEILSRARCPISRGHELLSIVILSIARTHRERAVHARNATIVYGAIEEFALKGCAEQPVASRERYIAHFSRNFAFCDGDRAGYIYRYKIDIKLS